jgi:glycosyltransferase involved in cell wall biosynthesis
MTVNPLISIVIPTYNDKRYVCEAIESGLAQTYSPCEIIVVDDGSTDGTSELLAARYRDRIRYIYQENRGLSAARNTGTRQAQGEFINYCDADDILLPVKIARCLELFEQYPANAVIYTDYEHVAEDGKTLMPRPHPTLPSGDIFCDLLIGPLGNFIHEAAPLVRRAVILEAGSFNESLRAVEDWDMWLRIAAHHTFLYVPDRLTLYRQRPNAMHTDRLRMIEARLHMIQMARSYPGRGRCLDDTAYDRLEAGRHHVTGIAYWEAGRRADARRAFQAAIALDPDRAARRRLYILLSYIFPARAASRLMQTGAWLKPPIR